MIFNPVVALAPKEKLDPQLTVTPETGEAYPMGVAEYEVSQVGDGAISVRYEGDQYTSYYESEQGNLEVGIRGNTVFVGHEYIRIGMAKSTIKIYITTEETKKYRSSTVVVTCVLTGL